MLKTVKAGLKTGLDYNNCVAAVCTQTIDVADRDGKQCDSLYALS